MPDDNAEPAPPESGADLAKAERKLRIWLAVVVFGIAVVIVGMLVLKDNDSADSPSGRLSAVECRDLQTDLDNQAAINDAADPGSSAFDRSLDRMSVLDGQLRDGGCYDVASDR